METTTTKDLNLSTSSTLDTNGFTNRDVRVEITATDLTRRPRPGDTGACHYSVRVWVPEGVGRASEVAQAWLGRLVGYPALGSMIQCSGYDNRQGCFFVSAGR